MAIRDSTGEAAGANAQPTTWKQLAAELCIFLLLVVPSALLSPFLLQQTRVTFVLTAASTILRDAGLVAPASCTSCGATASRGATSGSRSESGGEKSCGGRASFRSTCWPGQPSLPCAQRESPGPPATLPSFLTPRGWQEIALGIALVVVVAIGEEVMFRGYVMLRLQTLTSNPAVVVVLSAVIFASLTRTRAWRE